MKKLQISQILWNTAGENGLAVMKKVPDNNVYKKEASHFWGELVCMIS
jgi:hypothetical protein